MIKIKGDHVMSNAYNTAYDEFNGKYHVNLNLYNEYVNGKILDEIDDFATGVDVRTQEINAYLSTLSSAYQISFPWLLISPHSCS